jgi:RHS repeat-associated protein
MKYSPGEIKFISKNLLASFRMILQTTLIGVAFLILSLPLQSYAEVITPTDNNSNNTQNVPVFTSDGRTDVSNEIKNNLAPTGAAKDSVQNTKTDPKDKKSQTNSVDTQTSKTVFLPVGASSISAGGEADATPDDVSNVRGAGNPSNQSGAFEYSYAIDFPLGRNGLTPEVSLNYSSNATNLTSPFGYGWNTNIPKIERLNLTGTNKLYTENNYTSSLDGQLVAISSTTFKAQVENGSFNTYTFINNVWTVYDKAGTRYTFGSTTASRQDNASNTAQVASWMLDEVLDKNDEKITCTYFKSNGQLYPDIISYAFNAGTPLYTVKFVRSNLSSTTPNFIHSQFNKGFEEKLSYVIARIEVYTNNVKTLQIGFGYIYETWSTSLLSSEFTRTGYNESGVATVLPKTTFIYNTDFYSSGIPSLSFTNNATWASSTPNDLFSRFTGPTTSTSTTITESYYRTKIIDVNGDGLADWVSGGNVFMNTGAAWNATATWTGLPLNFDASYRLVDINGDSLPDRIKAKSYVFHPSLGTPDYKEVEFLFNQGDGTWVTNNDWSTTTPLLFYTEFTSATGSKSYGSYRNYFSDMNADGLIDWIYAGNVYMNTGVGFTATATWTGLPSNFETQDRLEDVNGDSLPDIVRAYQKTFDPSYSSTSTTTDYSIKLNRGDGTWQTDAYWTASIPSPIYTERQVSASLIYSTSTNVYFADMNGDSLPEWLVGERVYRNTGNSWSTASNTISIKTDNFSKDVRLTDVNGDALPDYVIASTQSWDASYGLSDVVFRAVQLNNLKKMWLLSTTTNEQGGTTAITYTPSTFPKSGVIQNPKSPYAIYTVSKVTADPVIGPKQTTIYDYAGGDLYHNPADVFTRKYAGFGTVTETSDLGKVKTYYHQGNGNATTSNETGDDYGKIGQSYRAEIHDLNGNLYQTTANLFATSTVATGSVYIRLSQSAKLDYDGDADRRDSAISYNYDNTNGNVLTQSEWGEVTANQDGTFTDTGTDKRVTTYTYASNTAANIIGLLASDRLDNQSGTKIKESRYYYDTLALGSVNKGNLTKTEAWATSSTYINTQSTFNAFGLKTQDLDPRGNATNYVYDSYNLYPATTTNALSQSTRYTYDYTSGKVKTMVDVNGFTHESIYDGLDRLLEIKEPRGTAGALVTVEKNTYTDTAGAVSVHNRKYLDSTYSVDSYVYFDGLGRTVQTRGEAENSNQFSVRDTVYGDDGNVQRESLPYFSNGIARTTATGQNSLYTKYAYDALNRKIASNTVLGTTSIAFDQWQETVTDTLSNVKKNNYDAYRNLSSVLEQNGTSTYTTTYDWTTHSQLAKVTDALGNIRSIQYNGLARRLLIEDLHATADTTFGKWSFVYDSAGNIGTTTDPKGQVIVTTYDALNRPTTENFTGLAGIEALYEYDTCTNGKGYLCTSVSKAATTTRQYNPAGLISSEVKTIGTTTYSQSYAFDRQNNQTQITYPDSSDVSYTFNTAGLLEKVEQRENGGAYRDIISNFNYGPTGQITYQLHGNGASTTRTYDDNELYRLRSIETTATNPTGGGGEALGLLEDGLLSSEIETSKSFSDYPLTSEIIESLITQEEITPSNITDLPSSEISTSTELTTTTITEDTTSTDISMDDVITGKPAIGFVDTKFTPKNIAGGKPIETAAMYQFISNEKDSGKKVTVEVDKYLPEVRFKKWGGEVDFDLTALDVIGDAVYSAEKNITQWKDDVSPMLVESYPLKPSAGMLDGGFEMEVVLQEKPASNIFTFAVSGDKNLDFFYQPALNTEEQNDPNITKCSETECTNKAGEVLVSRPENIVGSYAVYHKGNKDKSINVSDYATGKVGHIYRPKVIDASGNEVWATMSYETGLLSVEVPDDFLAKATYPVRVDPTFGYNVAGGSAVTGTAGNTIRGGSVVTTEAGLVDSVTIYVSGLTANVKGIITDGSLNLLSNGVSNAISVSSSTGAWYTMSYATATRPSVPSAGNYYLGMITSTTSPTFLYHFDTVSGYSRISDTTNSYTTPTNPTDAVITASRRISTYASYTAIAFTPFALWTEGTTSPTGITDTTPEFSAIHNDSSTSSVAVSYQIQVATTADFTNPYWDSAKEPLSSTTLQGTRTPDITYGGSPLVPVTTYYWRIKLWDAADYTGGWSVGTSTFALASSSASSTGFVPVVQHLTYTYDLVGNITQIVDKSNTKSAATTTYTYDPLYRLTSASTTLASSTPYKETYTYNAVGNITNKSGSGVYLYQGNTSSNYANPHAPTKIGTVTYVYDRNGNLTSNTASTTNIWDYRNRLTTARKGTATTTYKYDINEQRVQKTVGGKVTRYPSQYFETTGASTTKHVYANGMLVSTVDGIGSTTASVFHNHQDHLGSTAAVTSNIGYMTRLYNYYPYGSLRLDEGSASTTFTQPNQFIGQDRDKEADLSYLNARYYSSNQGMFTSQDPVFWEVGQSRDGLVALYKPQLQNSYSYGADSPIVNRDPDGRFLDTIADIGFIGYDLYSIGSAYVNGGDVKSELGYLGLDIAGAFTPFATGFGAVARTVKVVNKAENAVQGGIKVGQAGGKGSGKAFSQTTKNSAHEASNGKCVFCNVDTKQRVKGPTQSNTDHAIAKSRGGNNTPANAQNTCRSCNQSKGSKNSTEFLQKQLITVLKEYVKKLGG